MMIVQMAHISSISSSDYVHDVKAEKKGYVTHHKVDYTDDYLTRIEQDGGMQEVTGNWKLETQPLNLSEIWTLHQLGGKGGME